MKKRISLSFITIVFVSLILSVGTYAFFTSSVASNNNTLTTGVLTITAERDMGDPRPGPMFYTTEDEGKTPSGNIPNWPTGQWYPSKEVTRTLIVKNTGNIDAYLDGISAQVKNISDPAVAAEFAQHMNVTITPLSMPSSVLYSGPLSGIVSINKVLAINKLPISAGGEWYLNFTVTMHKDAGNNLQGLQPKVNFYVYAIQQAYQ